MSKLLTISELAERMNFKPRTVKGWVQKRIVPFKKMPGGDIRFDPNEIERWLDRKSVKVKSQIQ
jgi:excisionase family DNA binding protein